MRTPFLGFAQSWKQLTAGQEIDTLFIQKGLKGDIFPE
jgi:hypothetical protein